MPKATASFAGARGGRASGTAWQNVWLARAIALTGCRRGEITGLRQSEVDISGQALRLADRKTGESVRPIGKAAMDVIRAAVQKSGKVNRLSCAKREGSFCRPAEGVDPDC